MRKKLTAVLLAATMLLTSGVTVFADRVDAVIDKPYLALGADLSPQEQMTVLSLLGLSDINVDDYDIISITNADEHEYLDKYLDASIIGTRALSSVLPTILQLTRMPESLTSILVCLLPVVLPLQIHSICIIRRLLS